MEVELERRHDAEASPATPGGPEEVRMFGGADSANHAVGGDHLERAHVVAAQTVAALEMSHAASEGEAGNTCEGDLASGCGQPEQLRLPVDITQLAPASTRAVRAWTSTWTPVMGDRSMTRASSNTALPATWCPPPRMLTTGGRVRATGTASTTSAVPVQRAMTSGWLSMIRSTRGELGRIRVGSGDHVAVYRSAQIVHDRGSR